MPAFNIFDTVNTIYGPGFVSAVRSGDYVVLLTQWRLAQGQSPTLYLQEDALKKIPGAMPGTTVSSSRGAGTIVKIQPNGNHAVELKNGSVVEVDADDVKLSQSPGFDVGDEVMTTYGQGFIEGKRSADLVVKLRHWKLAQGQSPTLYLHPSVLTKIPKLIEGAVAKTVYGLARLVSIRRDGTHVCQAIHWRLADGKAPTLYLAPEAFALLSLKP